MNNQSRSDAEADIAKRNLKEAQEAIEKHNAEHQRRLREADPFYQQRFVVPLAAEEVYQDDDQAARISALEARVAELESWVAALVQRRDDQ